MERFFSGAAPAEVEVEDLFPEFARANGLDLV